MSNVRTFRDLPQPQGNRMQQGLLGNFPDCPMIMPRSYNVNPDPRKETYWDMLKFACCPLFTVKSFIFVISIVQIIYYIIALSIGMKDDEFLTPSYNSLDDLGAKVNSKLEDGEVWRWVLPMLLHANLAHIGSNLLSQFILGFRLEPTILVARMAILYVLSGIGGTLFSALVSDSLSVGASTAISGIVAAMFVYLFINWKALEPFQNARAMTLCWLIIMLLFNVVYGAVSLYFRVMITLITMGILGVL